MESVYSAYLKLLDRLPLGPLSLSHFVKNPTKAPDFIYRHHCQFRKGDFETTLWTATRARSEEITAWRGHDRDDTVENLVVLSDPDGNILIQDVLPEAEAARLMDRVLTAIRPYQDSLLTVVARIGSDHKAIKDACQSGLIYEVMGPLKSGL